MYFKIPSDMGTMKKIFKVTAAILQKDGNILIAQRKHRDHQSGKWEFPGGKIEPGETPEECLARELKEEFDIDVVVGEHLGSNIHHYDHISIELMVYRAFWHSGAISLNAHKAYRWTPIHQLAHFDFAPADIPFVDMLGRGLVDVTGKG